MIGYAIYIVTQQTKSYVRCNHIHGDHKCNKHQGMIFFLNFMPRINLARYNYRMIIIRDGQLSETKCIRSTLKFWQNFLFV